MTDRALLGPATGRRSFMQLLGGGALVLGSSPGLPLAVKVAGSSPVLDADQLGQLAFIERLSMQAPSDWAHMGAAEPGQGGFDSYRYQLAMMSYALSLAHYHYTPAWRDRNEQVSRRLIDKMLQFDVWSYWELTSRGAAMMEPGLKTLREGWIDPIRRQNIMYSGHLFQMVTAHQMLFGGTDFEKPGSLSFLYAPVARGLGPQRFDYDVHSIARVLAEEFRVNGWKGIECEPNAIFPECNQHPLLGLALYDARYGTSEFSRISRHFQEQFDSIGYLGRNNSYMSFYLVKQATPVRLDQAWANGWTGTFLHGWNKALAERAYPYQRSLFLARLSDGTATIRGTDGDEGYSHGHGFIAALAAEVGDEDTRDAMLRYADRYWNPTWNGETLSYPREDRFRHDGDVGNVWRRVQPLTGNGLIALARLGGRDRLNAMFSRPFGTEHYTQPFISALSGTGIQVARAVYDSEYGRLSLTLTPGRTAARDVRANFVVNNLDHSRPIALLSDGKPVARIVGGSVQLDPGTTATVGLADNGKLAVTLPISVGTEIIIDTNSVGKRA